MAPLTNDSTIDITDDLTGYMTDDTTDDLRDDMTDDTTEIVVPNHTKVFRQFFFFGTTSALEPDLSIYCLDLSILGTWVLQKMKRRDIISHDLLAVYEKQTNSQPNFKKDLEEFSSINVSLSINPNRITCQMHFFHPV